MMSTLRLIGVILASWSFLSVVLGVVVGQWLARAGRVRPQPRLQPSAPPAALSAARAKVEPRRPALASATWR
jgi:hypothetical protein